MALLEQQETLLPASMPLWPLPLFQWLAELNLVGLDQHKTLDVTLGVPIVLRCHLLLNQAYILDLRFVWPHVVDTLWPNKKANPSSLHHLSPKPMGVFENPTRHQSWYFTRFDIFILFENLNLVALPDLVFHQTKLDFHITRNIFKVCSSIII